MKSSQDSSIEVQRIIEKDAELRAMHKMDKKDGEFVKEMTGLLTRFTTKFYNVLNERGALQAGRQAKEKPIVTAGLAMK
jgi:predicted site-specific integrase-resolvase